MARLYVRKPPSESDDSSPEDTRPNSKPPQAKKTITADASTSKNPAPRAASPVSPIAQLESDLAGLTMHSALSTDEDATYNSDDSEAELRAKPPALDIYQTPKRTALTRLIRGTERKTRCSPEMGVVYKDVRSYVLEGEDDVTSSSESEGSLVDFVVGDDEVEYESDASEDSVLSVASPVPSSRRRTKQRSLTPEEEDDLVHSGDDEPRQREVFKRDWRKIEVFQLSDSGSDEEPDQPTIESDASKPQATSISDTDSSDNTFVSAKSDICTNATGMDIIRQVTLKLNAPSLEASSPPAKILKQRVITEEVTEIITVESDWPEQTIRSRASSPVPSLSSHGSDPEQGAILEYEPPRHKKPWALPPVTSKGKTTPPHSPAKAKAPKIPATPHRPSDARFWDMETVNNWNDQHSPQKTIPPTPGTIRVQPCGPLTISDCESEEDEDEDPQSTSSTPEPTNFTTATAPQPAPQPAPAAATKTKAETQREKAALREFLKIRNDMAEDLVREIDAKACNHRLAEFYKHTGGIKIVWKRSYRTTAGMAHYGKTTTKYPDGTHVSHPYANIYLSEKLLTNERKLIDTVAHEVCHLLAGGLDGSKVAHGKEFMAWGRRIEAALPEKGIKIRTFHDYKVDKKYEWTCSNTTCGYIYRRESKSIDITRFGCGVCKSKLVQTKPALRKESEWQKFMKDNYKRIAAENPHVPRKDIMGLVSKEWQEVKKLREEAKASSVAETQKEGKLVRLMEVLEV